MTGREMQEYFLTELTQWGKRPRIDSRDIFYWLNQAQDAMLEEYFDTLEKGGRHQVKVTDFLRPLFVKDAEVATTYVGEIVDGIHCDEAAFPADHLFLLAVRATTAVTGTPVQTIGQIRTGSDPRKSRVKIVQSDDVYYMVEDPFHKPTAKLALGDVTEGTFHVYTDATFVATSIFFDYIREPAEISTSQSAELPDFVHNDVVSRAVSLFVDKDQEVTQKHQSKSLEQLT